jgi:enoyl-CoA hydratase/carnithine racemase
MTHSLTVTKSGHVAELVFANPAHNHATVGLLGDIGAALADLDADMDVRAIVLASDGKPFCAGADLATPGGFGTDSADPIREFYDKALTIFAAKKPLIAAVHGAAVGAGLGLAVAADFRVASPEARFAGNFTRLGFHPGFGLTATLPRLIGQQRALEMFMTSGRYKPEDVAPWGLVDRLAPSGKARDVAHVFAAEITENAPLALVATRATLRADLLKTVRAQLIHEHAEQAKLRATADYAEGVASVFERRAANFTGS